MSLTSFTLFSQDYIYSRDHPKYAVRNWTLPPVLLLHVVPPVLLQHLVQALVLQSLVLLPLLHSQGVPLHQQPGEADLEPKMLTWPDEMSGHGQLLVIVVLVFVLNEKLGVVSLSLEESTPP